MGIVLNGRWIIVDEVRQFLTKSLSWLGEWDWRIRDGGEDAHHQRSKQVQCFKYQRYIMS